MVNFVHSKSEKPKILLHYCELTIIESDESKKILLNAAFITFFIAINYFYFLFIFLLGNYSGEWINL
jgi:hypothetical protein